MFRHFSRQEARNLVFLAIPVFLGQIAQIAMSFVDTVVAGRAGTVDMAAVAVATSFWIPGTMFGQGLIMAITPLVAQALGAGNRIKSRHFLRQGLWLAAGISLLLMAIFMVISHTIPRWGTMDAMLAQKTSEYLFAVLWGVPALMLFVVQRCFLEGHGRTRPAMVAGFVGLALNVPLNIIFVFGKFGLPAMGAAGCGVATAILFWFMAAAMFFFVRHTDKNAPALEKPSVVILKRLVRIGLPSAFAMLNETAAFALIALIVSPLGVTTVSGHQIAINVSAFVWMCPFSIGAASTIRVGTLLGSGNMEGAKSARLTALTITLAMACVLAVLIYLVRYPVAALYTGDQAVIQMARPAPHMRSVLSVSRRHTDQHALRSEGLERYQSHFLHILHRLLGGEPPRRLDSVHDRPFYACAPRRSGILDSPHSRTQRGSPALPRSHTQTGRPFRRGHEEKNRTITSRNFR